MSEYSFNMKNRFENSTVPFRHNDFEVWVEWKHWLNQALTPKVIYNEVYNRTLKRDYENNVRLLKDPAPDEVEVYLIATNPQVDGDAVKILWEDEFVSYGDDLFLTWERFCNDLHDLYSCDLLQFLCMISEHNEEEFEIIRDDKEVKALRIGNYDGDILIKKGSAGGFIVEFMGVNKFPNNIEDLKDELRGDAYWLETFLG
ncbi:MAG: hypothetical protein CL489_10450 [Acidobacteria bacterium]|nr:hypothetical protein [Acidobacteriota bacterium]|tara:strand:+ start:128 stop:730 length:603 start_codon:yes stop_codon:yes gene_type:complete